ncbi:MAG TPA: DUF6438 domain-containing protein [Mucilaginibacter sp.]|nr:DUF6438 domain-containing protein [Mucilaginibacter sp.]
MKTLIITLFALLSLSCKANEIDKLKNISDVNTFLRKVVGKKWDGSFFDVKPDTTSKLFNVKFLKIDINDDGLTDLILNGADIVAVVDNGKGGYDFHLISQRGGMTFKKYVLAGTDTTKPAKIIVKTYYTHAQKDEPVIYDTLVVKFGAFVEYSRNIDHRKVRKLSFSTTACFGKCPVFDLHIESDGTAEYDAYNYNSETGRFTGKIDSIKLNQLFGLIEYLNLKSLNDNYKVLWTDDQTCMLTVRYNDGTVKTIQDYGGEGTFGLRQLYHLLFGLRKSQYWYATDN